MIKDTRRMKPQIPFNVKILGAVLRGNRRAGVGLERFKVFPEHPSESCNPQTVPRNKRFK